MPVSETEKPDFPRLSMSELTTLRWSFERDLQEFPSAGFRSIGVWRTKMSDYDEDEGARLLADSSLCVSSLAWAGGFTGSDGRTHEDSVQDAKEAIRLAARLGTDCLIVYAGGRGGHTYNHAYRLLRTALDELVPMAEDFEVTLAFEPMHPGCAADWTFLTSIDQVISLIQDVGSHRIGAVYDAYHAGLELPTKSQFEEITKFLKLVQLADGRGQPQGDQNRLPIGAGDIPLREIVSRLCEAGYEGYYEFELFGEAIEPDHYSCLLESSVTAFEGLFSTTR